MVSESNEKSLSMTNIFIYLVLSGVMAFVQGISAFTVISLISTVSYSVANATKRIVVIVVSILTLKNPVKCKHNIFVEKIVLGQSRSSNEKVLFENQSKGQFLRRLDVLLHLAEIPREPLITLFDIILD